MNEQEAVDFVIRELGKHHQRNEIIQKLCENVGMNWGQAEKFIQRVETEHRSSIALKQSPIITMVGIGIIIVGLAITFGIALLTLRGYIIFFLGFPVPYLGNFFYFFVGIAMIIGGLRGIWDTVRHLWNS